MKQFILALFLLCLLITPLLASDSITIHSNGEASVKADLAIIRFYVIESNEDACDAFTHINKRIKSIANNLELELLPSTAEVTTVCFTSEPTVIARDSGGFKYYRELLIKINLTDLTDKQADKEISRYLDLVTEFGGNYNNGEFLQFTIKDHKSLYNKALQDAIAKANNMVPTNYKSRSININNTLIEAEENNNRIVTKKVTILVRYSDGD